MTDHHFGHHHCSCDSCRRQLSHRDSCSCQTFDHFRHSRTRQDSHSFDHHRSFRTTPCSCSRSHFDSFDHRRRTHFDDFDHRRQHSFRQTLPRLTPLRRDRDRFRDGRHYCRLKSLRRDRHDDFREDSFKRDDRVRVLRHDDHIKVIPDDNKKNIVIIF